MVDDSGCPQCISTILGSAHIFYSLYDHSISSSSGPSLWHISIIVSVYPSTEIGTGPEVPGPQSLMGPCFEHFSPQYSSLSSFESLRPLSPDRLCFL